MNTIKIEERYNGLAEEPCCLSCGNAVNLYEPAEGNVCIDLGSGKGLDVLKMAEQVGPTGKVYGVDVSEEMLEKARKTADKLGVKHVEFIRSDLERIALDSKIADLIISNCTLNHVADKKAVWNEIFRLLKKGGRFVISDIYASETVPENYRNDPDAVAECWAGSVTRDEYIKTVTEAGFPEFEIKEESQPYKKGEIFVSSFTITAIKNKCCNN
jgi:arsenite methyltransferase